MPLQVCSQAGCQLQHGRGSSDPQQQRRRPQLPYRAHSLGTLWKKAAGDLALPRE